MKLADTKALVAECTHGEPASCTHACPFHMDIRTFTDRCARGKWLPAYKQMRGELFFPAIVAALCDAPCQKHCQRSAISDEPIDLPRLERAVLRHTKRRPVENYAIPPRTERVAVVGAGVAGLSLALAMAQKKYPVTVFDREDGWGGRLRAHPDWPVFDADIALQFSATDTEFRFGTQIDDPGQLSDYDVIYVATGSGGSDFGLLPSYDSGLQTTENPRVFLGGELCGTTLMEGIAQGADVSRTLEVFVQTGNAAATLGGYSGRGCERYPAVARAPRAPLVVPAEGEDYSPEEAAQEGARCLQCDCSECLERCEMLHRFRKKPEKIAVEVYTDSKVSPPIATHSITRQTYSCNMCGHCKAVCPGDVYMGELFHMSRKDRVATETAPFALHDYWLREMDFSVGDAAFAAAPRGRETCEYVFFPGCQLGAYRPEHVLKSYEFLRDRYDAGIILGCCGAPAHWSGDTARQDHNIAEIRATAARLGNPKFVFACATCETMFAEFMPEIPRVSLYELLAEDSEIKVSPLFHEAAVFDPCAARGDAAMQGSVRALAEKAGITLEELSETNRCCGYGGLIQLANPSLFDTIVENRTEMSRRPYIVYCANCHEVFTTREKSCVHILDMVFGLPEMETLPKIAARRQNSLDVKGEIMKQTTDQTFAPEAPDWAGVRLQIAPDLADEIDRKLISEDDLKEAIWRAETAGDKFIDGDSGALQCCLIRPVLTYWVRYRALEDGAYEVLNAYYHRMSFSRED